MFSSFTPTNIYVAFLCEKEKQLTHLWVVVVLFVLLVVSAVLFVYCFSLEFGLCCFSSSSSSRCIPGSINVECTRLHSIKRGESVSLVN